LLEAPALASSNTPASVGKVTGYSNSRRRPSRRYDRGSADRSPSPGPTCSNCGRSHATKEECSARNKICNFCKKIGHFRSVCRFRKRDQSTKVDRRPLAATNGSSGSESDDDGSTNIVYVNSVYVDSTVAAITSSAETGTYKHVHCRVANAPITMLLDLGAKVSIIARDYYRRHLSRRFALETPLLTLRTYSGQQIPCAGCITAPIQLGKRIVDFTFYITERGRSIMGVDLFDALGGKVFFEGATVSNVNTTPEVAPSLSTVSLDEFPALLKNTGTLKGFVHRPHIDLSVRPTQQKFWHPPLAMRDAIAAEIRRMEAEGVIQPVDASPWMSNLVVAGKKDGGVRLCVNLTAVNKAVIPDRYPLPTMEELTEKLAGSNVFSKIDLLWGYTQLELAQEARHMTSFMSHIGCYCFRSLPFGLASGPSAFHKVICQILAGLPGCASILDDIIIFGKDVADHDANLRRVLAALAKANATVRVDKCVIGQPSVEFNGHKITAQGIKPLQSNVDAILRMPVPKDQKQLLRFVSTANYYLKFVQGFADLCDPLRQLLKADTPWHWSDQHQQCFQRLKDQLVNAPVLAHFDVNAQTFVTCDASGSAIAACLSQRTSDNGVERPIAYISRALSQAERKYSATEREALACMWACERLDFYLYGRKFTLVTDHAALTSLLAPTGTGHRPLRLHRWYDRLWKYNFTPIYRRGVDNVVADCLSRSYDVTIEGDNQPPVHQDPDDALVQTVFGALAMDTITISQLIAATAEDSRLQQVIDYVISGWPTKRQSIMPELRLYYDRQAELSVSHNGQCLLRGERVVIPPSLQETVLQLAHEGHPGIIRMKQRCRMTVWWPGIDADIERFVEVCESCVTSGKSVRPLPGPLQPVALPSGPWKKISLDLAGEFIAAPAHQKYLIVAVDYYSKWPEAATCGNPTTEAVIEFLTILFDRFGLVDEICTDNGVQFTSAAFAQFLRRHDIKHTRSALYAPQTQGEVERFNRVLKEGIKAAIADGKSFFTGVRQTLAAYRTTPHRATGCTPASLMLAFTARTPLGKLAAAAKPDVSWSSNSVHEDVARRVRFAQSVMKNIHDVRKRTKASVFKPGDFIRIKLPTVAHKLAPVYSEPVGVTRVQGNTVWTADGKRWNLRRCILHKSMLGAKNRPPDMTAAGQEVTGHSDVSSDVSLDTEEKDEAVFSFEWPTPAGPAPARQVVHQTAQAPVRRSNRALKPKQYPGFYRYE
jgi:RNase H-like domain found in reverse transcriptase/Integrase zinc binding domain/Integrase core domain/Reverse transcriptase (RNA-dependent DNA polymerase)